MSTDLEAPARSELRTRIVDVADRLLRDEGIAAVTTRRVAEASGVQAPTIYRLFGDKEGLLDAVAEHAMAAHVSRKASRAADDEDPVKALVTGWRSQIDFGLSNPQLIRLMNARSQASPAIEAGVDVLRSRIRGLAAAGLLRVSEQRAVGMIHAAGTGAVQALLETPPQDRDAGLADSLLDAVLAQIVGPKSAPPDAGSAISIAVQFATIVPDLPGLSIAEQSLLSEWLDKSIQTSQ